MKKEQGFSPGGERLKEGDLYQVVKNFFDFDFVTGLPCGELRNFVWEAKHDTEVIHLQSTNERESIGISAGAWLAGARPVLYMQNSGFFEASNDIASLLIACKIPTVFVVSWRGAPGEKATQHLVTGPSTKPLLEAFGIEYTEDPLRSNLLSLKTKQAENKLPVAVLIKREKYNNGPVQADEGDLHWFSDSEPVVEPRSDERLTQKDVLEVLFDRLITKDDAVFSSTGLISRSIYENFDSPNQFYNAGGFGITSSIALGFAAKKDDVRTFVVEGEGSVLTNLGALNLIGHYHPKNFIHVVLDNGSYASCSGEKNFGSESIPAIANSFGYEDTFSVESSAGLNDCIDYLRSRELVSGPVLLKIRTGGNGRRDFKRPLDMSGLALRFREYFK